MRQIGFSTGALALSDFRRATAMVQRSRVRYIELSALRQEELAPLFDGIDELPLSEFDYVSIHAPSAIRPQDEMSVANTLLAMSERGWPIILHPDAIHDFAVWRRLGRLLAIENMDKRKPIGRTARELAEVFRELPQASFCLDIGHARQVDPTMKTAYFLLKDLGDRLCQVHLSEVNTRSTHDALSYASILAFREVADMIPDEVPVILETPVAEHEMEKEIDRANEALPTSGKLVACM